MIRHERSRKLLILLTIFLVQLFAPVAHAQSNSAGADEIKAAFLLNFVRFTEWPPQAFSDASQPVVIGIYGKELFGSPSLNGLRSKMANGRSITFRSIANRNDVPGCHVLFVTGMDKEVVDIIDRARRKNILTVGEDSGFLLAGGMIRLFVEQDKVRFEVNLLRVDSASLKLSAKLLGVAAKVYK